MFETLFCCPAALRRHREGPLVAGRAKYLQGLVANGMAQGTVVRQARYCLCVAVEVQRWPSDHCFDDEEIRAVASDWAAKRVASGRASSPRWPEESFRVMATEFLRVLGRLRPAPAPEPGRYHQQLAEFIAAQQERRWLSSATCESAKWQVEKFLDYLEQRDVALGDVSAVDVDAYFQLVAQRWSRSSLHTSARMLRTWFAYCETQHWVQPGLAQAILLPRIYRHEGLPLGPTWETVGRVLAETAGDDPASLRDHAIVLLLSVYGLRSGEVRGLQLNDLDWSCDRIRVFRSKSGRQETLPLEPRVGNAIARYLRHGRPKSGSRAVFLRLRAPYRPLSTAGLYGVVERRLRKVSPPNKGRGPHGLRHACARHLIESGRSFKQVGDHLGHRSPEATRIYAKVNLTSLRRVALDDLGGLA